MPDVTETTSICLILPIRTNEQSTVRRFLHHANRTIFERETNDRFELVLTHIVTSKHEQSQTLHWFKSIRQQIDVIRQIHTRLNVTYHTLRISSTLPSYDIQTNEILDYFHRRVRRHALLLIVNPYTDIESDFLNRCRLNAIEHRQIFFPIAFYQYHPKIIARTQPIANNSTINLHKSHGWFNAYAFEHVALYANDYINLKQILLKYNVTNSTSNIYDLFVQWSNLHVLRAPDQSLRVHYRPVQCESLKRNNPNEFSRCQMQQEKGLASRSQLAMLVIEHERQQVTNTTSKQQFQ
jgi:hypothetical protein